MAATATCPGGTISPRTAPPSRSSRAKRSRYRSRRCSGCATARKWRSPPRSPGPRKAEIGAHLHPWVTPPHLEEVSHRNSYQCNLPAELERAKIETLTAAIEAAFGERPTAFKAGRHGFGRNTARALSEFGYRVDCSQLPHTDLSADEGPDFRGLPAEPYWLDAGRGLLEVPVTIGFFGAAAALGPRLGRLFDSPALARLRVPGLLARSGLVARTRLTPEGVSAEEQCRLIEALARRGQAIFSLVYHSPSLEA